MWRGYGEGCGVFRSAVRVPDLAREVEGSGLQTASQAPGQQVSVHVLCSTQIRQVTETSSTSCVRIAEKGRRARATHRVAQEKVRYVVSQSFPGRHVDQIGSQRTLRNHVDKMHTTLGKHTREQLLLEALFW